MTKYRDRYYLQYATPGTVAHWYCDTVMEGESATGPFQHVDYAPASFIGSAGHRSMFQDRHGNWLGCENSRVTFGVPVTRFP